MSRPVCKRSENGRPANSEHRSRRDRMSKERLLLQTDGSRHDCHKDRVPWLTVVGYTADATGHTDQAQADNQHAGDGAAAEGDLHGGIQAVIGCLGGAHIGAHRDVHADVAGHAGENSADGETDGGHRDQINNDDAQVEASQSQLSHLSPVVFLPGVRLHESVGAVHEA